jgi:hypothetical protein
MDDATIYSYRFESVPEPSTAILLLTGACVAALSGRRYWSRVVRQTAPFGFLAIVAVLLLTSMGCGVKATGTALHGSVTCNGKVVPTGTISFVPSSLDAGAVRSAAIVNGKYEFVPPSVLPFGKYRVQVDARTPTGRKVQKANGREPTMVDETTVMGQAIYAGTKSPLSVEIAADSSNVYDIVLQ